ncbi:mitochondrial inner membrane protease ATP23 homolog [Caerostris extrusa]|uniref:Mitochondrial inner membrane protease ATP23 n=1 Tax=Caerostris extrusa TaxID=172846 RepID=A0AAV4RV85_CAEEX|nr:mitochondrial inner membrane protease ATP23 homolog [Caerostris extrusa]
MSEESNENTEKKYTETLGDPTGIEFFPERRGDKIARGWFRTLFVGEGRDNLQKLKCERQVHNVISESPLIKLMMDALKTTGCAIDLNRHISCEPCSKVVTGGYDAEMNQIVVCQNTATSKSAVHGALAHEMVHMFDFCRAHVDFKNVDHLLCTEIRAANLMHCSFMSALVMGTASLIRIKKQHQECVKRKALASVMAVRDLSPEEAKAAMDRVFTKCYNDLEPLGRRLRRNSEDIHKVYRERYLNGYGYS